MSNQFASFLATEEPAELGPSQRKSAKSQADLEKQLGPLFHKSGLPDERQELIRALILLWHDHLDAAHEIAQGSETADGAFVHGIMHRREPDFGNAAYWFRRVGRHPAFNQIADKVTARLTSPSQLTLTPRLVPNGKWDPFAFIDACAEASRGSDPNGQLLREIQGIEFGALLDSLLTTA